MDTKETKDVSSCAKLLTLNNIRRPSYVKDFKRLGRGAGENGCKSGRGNKGQRSRAGGANPKTEGGQFKSYLRAKKRGFTRRSVEVNIIKTSSVEALASSLNSTTVTLSQIQEYMNLNKFDLVKLLFDKTPLSTITVEVHAASESAKKVMSVNLVKTKSH